jgi:RimJ/RimL family protein N-acetyltransferase
MRLRSATRDDARLLFVWRNDPATRESSFSTQPVSWDDHRAWLDRVVDDPHRALYVAEDERGPVGTVRMDLDPEPATISVTVAPDRRGEGQASRLIAAAAEHHHPPIVALIKPGNDASVRAFERAGFRHRGEQDGALRLVYDGHAG